MSLITTQYGREIILTALGYAKGWKEQHCVENNVDCYRYLFENDYSRVVGNPWCAFLATKVINDAADRLRIHCPLPFQGSSRAIVDRAKALGIRVDNTPAIGSLFWYATKTGGHTGIIVWGNSKGLLTVEGNSGDQLRCYNCPQNAVALIGANSNRSYDYMSKNLKAVYVHVEEIGDTAAVEIENAFTMPISSGQQPERTLNAGMSTGQALLMLSLIGGGIYAAVKS